MPFIDSTGVYCGMTDCRFHDGLIMLGCTNLSIRNKSSETYFKKGNVASLKKCPCYEKGVDGYTSTW